MRIITYSTKINRENSLTELVKENAYNYKTENKHLDCAEKIASMICDLFELHMVLCQDLVQVKMRNFSPF